jgi:DNA-binding transcriptional MerR regulator
MGGQRRYDSSVINALAVIRMAKDAGLTIAEIRRLSHGFDRETPASARWRQLAKQKRDALISSIEQARRTQRLLDSLLACKCVELAECPGRCAPSSARFNSLHRLQRA